MNISELKNIGQRSAATDWTGIAVLLLYASSILSTILIPVTALAEYDPLYYLSEKLLVGCVKETKLAIRLIVCSLTSKEVSETVGLIDSILMCALLSTTSILKYSSKRGASEGIEWYKKLQIVTSTAMAPGRKFSAVMISLGFVLVISGNYGIFAGSGVIPIPIYACHCVVQVALYAVVGLTLPRVVACFTFSNDMITAIWPKSLIGNYDKFSRRRFHIQRKTIRSLMPITFYYGTARFDEETKTSFYVHTLLHTIDLLLVK